MKYLVLGILNLIFFNGLFAQCSITNEKINGGIIYKAKYEEIFRNVDLENGIKMLQLSASYMTTPNQAPMLMIDIVYARSGIQSILVPRKLKINLSDATSIELTAELNDSPNLSNNIKVEKSTFVVMPTDTKRLSELSTKSIVVSDPRTATSVFAQPYPTLLQEQINCLLKYGN